MNSRESIAKPGNRVSIRSKCSLILIGLCMLVLTGCATVLSVSEYSVDIDSVPSNLEIVVTDSDGNIEFRGKTPAVVDLEAGGGYFVREKYTVTLYDGGKVVGKTTIDGSLDLWYFAKPI